MVDMKQKGSGVVKPAAQPEDPLTRQQVYDFMVSERDRVRFCATLPLTFIVWGLFALTAWTHGNVEQTFRSQSMIRRAVQNIQVDHRISVLGSQEVYKRIALNNVSTTDEVWTWLIDGFVPLFAGRPESPGVVRNFNQVIRPGIQLRQKRVMGIDCPVSEELREYFRSECRSLDNLPERYGPEANVTNGTVNDRAFVAGGGFEVATMGWNENPKELFYGFLKIDRETDANTGVTHIRGQTRAKELRDLKWMDDATDSLKITVTLLNPEVPQFTLITVNVDIVRGGLVKTTLDVRPLQLIVWQDSGEVAVDIIWGVLTFFTMILTLQEVVDRKGNCGNKCCGSFWLLVDWTGILVGFAIIAFFLVYSAGIDSLDQHVAKLPMALSQTEVTTTEPPPPRLAADFALLAKNQELAEQGWLAQFQEDLELMIIVKIYHRLGMFWYVGLVLLRLFRGFSGQPRIAAIGRTVGKAASDLGHLLIIETITFMNLTLGGQLLFGPDLEAWHTFADAAMTSISFLFGQGDASAMFEIAPISTLIWGTGYVIAIVIMLMGMVSAILLDHYFEVRKSCGMAMQTLPQQAWAGVEDFVWKRSYECRLVLRFLKGRAKEGGVLDRILPFIKPEEVRISKIPYDRLIAYFDSEDDGIKNPPPPPPWTPVTLEHFVSQGVDVQTAKRLMNKCRAATSVLPMEEMPVMRLFEEFETSTLDSFNMLDITAEELKNWVYERKVDIHNMEPRQRKLEMLSRKLEPAEPMFGLEMPETETGNSDVKPAVEAGNSSGQQRLADGSAGHSQRVDANMLQN